MATKKYIVKQTTNWNGRGEKTGTHVVNMDEEEIMSYVGYLDGSVEVYELNTTYSSVGAPTATTSLNFVDSIRFSHSMAKTVYVSNSNKRPIIFKTGQDLSQLRANFASYKPFASPYNAEVSKDVSLDSGNISLL